MSVKSVLSYLASKKFWVELFIMTAGMLIAAAAVYYFLVPSNLIVGSITGLSMVLNKIIPLPLSTIVFVINAFLLILSYFLIGKEFGMKTVYTALILGPILEFYEHFLPWTRFATEIPGTGILSVMGDPWLDMLVFVIVLSASQSILFKINASTGGLDILGKIVNKYFHLDIGTSVSVAGALICCTAFLIDNPFNLVILGLIGTWINGIVIDYFTAGMNKKKRVNIISPEYQKIQEFILKELVRGCTLNEVVGGYSGEKKVELQVLLNKDEFQKLMDFINKNHIETFMTADTITEVYGFWGSNNKKKRLDRRKL